MKKLTLHAISISWLKSQIYCTDITFSVILEDKTDEGNKTTDDLIPEIAAGAAVSLDALDKVMIRISVSCAFWPKNIKS